MYILQPLLRAGVFQPGPKLTCSVSGVTYYAELRDNGEIRCLCGCSETYRSPSAFSVHIKRKVNPTRKADDGWTSTRYLGVPLGAYRAKLEQLLLKDQAASDNPAAGDTDNKLLLTQVLKQKRKGKAAHSIAGAQQQEGSDTAEDSDQTHEAPAPTAPQPGHLVSSNQCCSSNSNHKPLLDQQEQQHKDSWANQCTGALPPVASLGIGYLRQCAPLQHQQPCADLRYTWVRCSNPNCCKWRQVEYTGHPPAHMWTCSDDKHTGSACSLPQQLPDHQVKLLLQDEVCKRFAAASTRPPLQQCSQEVFESDLIAFLVARGDEQLAVLVRDKRITCNNSSLDLFGLYREVVKQGGLISNESYDERGRWNGGINFAGDVFPRLMNFTVNNRATSVGNQLLNNYKKFLLAYERAYHSRDVQVAALVPSADGPGSQEGAASPTQTSDVLDEAGMQECEPLALLADAALAPVAHHQQQQQQQLVQQQQCDQQQAPAVCPSLDADAVHPAKRHKPSTPVYGNITSMSTEGAAVAGDTAVGTVQQAQQQQESGQQKVTHCSIAGAAESLARLLAAATAAMQATAANDHGWCLPGSLILSQQQHQHQHKQQAPAVSAAVVAHIDQLPAALASAAAGRCCIKQGQAHAGPSTALAGHSTHLPVLLLGSKQLCWVDRCCCEPFSVATAQAALQAAWGSAHLGGMCMISSSSSNSNSNPFHFGRGNHNVLKHQAHKQELRHMQGLKQAVQWAVSHSNSSVTWATATDVDYLSFQPSRWVTSAGCAAVADELLLLEAQLPVVAGGSSSSISSAFWECWRDAVQAASTPEQLAHQVLMLAYQCEALLLPHTADTMWAELHQLLGVAQGLDSRTSSQRLLETAAAAAAAGAAAEQASQSQLLLDAPSVLSVSQAVRVLAESLDRDRIKQMWHSDLQHYCQAAKASTPATFAATGSTLTPLVASIRAPTPQQQQTSLLSAVQAALAAEGCSLQQLHAKLLGKSVDQGTMAEPPHPVSNAVVPAAIGFMAQLPTEGPASSAAAAGLCKQLVGCSSSEFAAAGVVVDGVCRQSSDSFMSCGDAVTL